MVLDRYHEFAEGTRVRLNYTGKQKPRCGSDQGQRAAALAIYEVRRGSRTNMHEGRLPRVTTSKHIPGKMKLDSIINKGF